MHHHLNCRLLGSVFGVAAALTGLCTNASAFDFSGGKSIVAITADGGRTSIGTIQFTPGSGDTSAFKISFRTEAFTDHFLSMREFKCLPGPKEISCHVPYPYPSPSTVSAGDLAWLEHSLLFLYKSPAEFGAKLWNGVYFEFEDKGSSLVGTHKAVDLNEISAPPSNLKTAPFKKSLRHDMPAGSRWISHLVIE